MTVEMWVGVAAAILGSSALGTFISVMANRKANGAAVRKCEAEVEGVKVGTVDRLQDIFLEQIEEYRAQVGELVSARATDAVELAKMQTRMKEIARQMETMAAELYKLRQENDRLERENEALRRRVALLESQMKGMGNACED